MNRDNHYEAAFEAYLRGRGVAVVPVDEARRSYLDANEVKSPDFIVVGPSDVKLIVDVKGRKFPGGPIGRPRKTWENWSTREDIDGLERWAHKLGPDFRGMLAFVYHIQPIVALPDHTPDLFTFRGQLYLMRGIPACDYAQHMRSRSPRWGTVHLDSDSFRSIVRPFSDFLTRSTLNPVEVPLEAECTG